jgi:hypothetical protein
MTSTLDMTGLSPKEKNPRSYVEEKEIHGLSIDSIQQRLAFDGLET